MQFLRGLNDQYSYVKSHVLLMEALPSISKIFSYMSQQERQLMSNGANLENKIVAVATNGSSSTCTICGKGGTLSPFVSKRMGSQIIMETSVSTIIVVKVAIQLIRVTRNTSLSMLILKLMKPRTTMMGKKSSLQNSNSKL